MMGRGHFWHVGLPLARPAIVAGLALVLMETVSDFGTVEYFAVETLTLGIFNVWLGMNSLTAAAQIAAFSFSSSLSCLRWKCWRARAVALWIRRVDPFPWRRGLYAAGVRRYAWRFACCRF